MARGLALAAVAVLVLLIAAGPAAAASGTFTCATVQAGINQAQQGDVIVLDSSAAPGGLCNMQVTLKSFPSPIAFPNNYTTWTFKGRDGMNDGFDGSSLAGRVLTGNDVHRIEIQELTFRDSTAAGNGGAVSITGESSVGLRSSEFYNNDSDARGGAVYISQEPAVLGATLGGIGVSGNTFGSLTNPSEGNTAVTGGALAIETPGQGNNSGINTSTFANNVAEENGGAFDYALDPGGSENLSLDFNTVVDNRAGGSGGGAHVVVDSSFLSIDQNTFEGNSVEPVTDSHPAGDHFGGGLFAEGGFPRLRNNVFRGNAVKQFGNGESYGGGGLALFPPDAINVQSDFGRYESNTVAGQPAASQHESEGGGLFFSSPGGRYYGFLDAIAGNSVGANGEGGGIYIGADTDTRLELGEATVAGNTVGAGGQFAGIAGDPDDDLIMRNSIVYNGAGDIGGFDSFDISFSDACNGGAPFSGPGNICADPRLVGGADVHQTKASPTIDKGSDQFFDSEGGGERNPTDYEGDPRPTDGDGDGHTIDMGADETPAGFTAQQPPPPPPPPPPPQCSDGADNDTDGAIDSADPGCLPGPTDNNEGDETARDLVLCGQRTISLVRADVRGSKVVLSGIVATSVAGQKVDLSVRYLGGKARAQKLGSVTPGADGTFQARVKKPSRKLFSVARYRAQVGSARSVELKLPQSLASSSLKQAAGGMLELRGQVDRAVLGKRNPVVIKRILCGKYTTVGQAKPNKRGAYAVRFPSPPSQGSALYRAETKVLARPGSKRYVKQFARAIGITF